MDGWRSWVEARSSKTLERAGGLEINREEGEKGVSTSANEDFQVKKVGKNGAFINEVDRLLRGCQRD